VIPFLGIGPELRFGASRGLSLRCAVALEASLIRQRFSLNGETVMDLERLRLVGELGIGAALP
jgi:hypothetical protein